MGSNRADRCRRVADKSAAISAREDRSTGRTPSVLALGNCVFASNKAENGSRRSTLTPEPVVASPPWRRQGTSGRTVGVWVYPADPYPTGIIWRKVDTTLALERYFRAMFAKRAERKLVAQIAERRRGWMQRISGAKSQ